MAPYGVAAIDEGLEIADGLGTALLRYDGTLERTGKITDHGFPGYVRGLARAPQGVYTTNSVGEVGRWDTGCWTVGEIWASDFSETMGVTATNGEHVVVAEAGTGRVVAVTRDGTVSEVAKGFERPVGVACTANGTLVVSDEERGTVERIDGDGTRTVLADGLSRPHDVAIFDDTALVIEAAAQRLLSIPLSGGEPTVLAEGLPTGSGPGKVRDTLNGLPMMMPGPISPFAGLDVGPDGRVFVSGDANGTIVVLKLTSD
jgi:glucose/arabinose dehydrogenase